MLLLEWIPFHPSIRGGEPCIQASLPLVLNLVKNFHSKLLGDVEVFVVPRSSESEKELEELCNPNGLDLHPVATCFLCSESLFL